MTKLASIALTALTGALFLAAPPASAQEFGRHHRRGHDRHQETAGHYELRRQEVQVPGRYEWEQQTIEVAGRWEVSYQDVTIPGRYETVEQQVWVPGRWVSLGTDGFGRSDDRASLRRHFEVNAEHVAFAAASVLVRAGNGAITKRALARAMDDWGIDPEAVNPVLL